MALKRANPPSVNRRASPISTSSSATDRVDRPQSSPSVEPLLAHERLEVSDDLLLLAIERVDLLVVAVEQLQAQPRRRVVAPAAVAPCERREPWLDRLGVGQLLAQLQRQLAEQVLGLVDEVLAAGEDRAPPVMPQRQQLVQLIGPLVLPCALERRGSSECASTSRAIRSESSVSDLPRWRARSDRGVRFAHTSRTS